MLQLTEFAQARVWCGEAVPAFASAGSMSREVDADPTASVALTRVTIEAFVPRGARAEYGLLGMSFQGMGDRVLSVDVPFSEEDGGQWPDSLARVVDDVRVGLPAEYVTAILDTVSATGERRLPPGSIRVVEAAHGIVGSSANFFGKLAVCVLELMHNERHHEDKQMAAFLTTRLVR